MSLVRPMKWSRKKKKRRGRKSKDRKRTDFLTSLCSPHLPPFAAGCIYIPYSIAPSLRPFPWRLARRLTEAASGLAGQRNACVTPAQLGQEFPPPRLYGSADAPRRTSAADRWQCAPRPSTTVDDRACRRMGCHAMLCEAMRGETMRRRFEVY